MCILFILYYFWHQSTFNILYTSQDFTKSIKYKLTNIFIIKVKGKYLEHWNHFLYCCISGITDFDIYTFSCSNYLLSLNSAIILGNIRFSESERNDNYFISLSSSKSLYCLTFLLFIFSKISNLLCLKKC